MRRDDIPLRECPHGDDGFEFRNNDHWRSPIAIAMATFWFKPMQIDVAAVKIRAWLVVASGRIIADGYDQNPGSGLGSDDSITVSGRGYMPASAVFFLSAE